MQRSKNHCTASDFCGRYCNSLLTNIFIQRGRMRHFHRIEYWKHKCGLLFSRSCSNWTSYNISAIISSIFIYTHLSKLNVCLFAWHYQRNKISRKCAFVFVLHINRILNLFWCWCQRNFHFLSHNRMVSGKLNTSPYRLVLIINWKYTFSWSRFQCFQLIFFRAANCIVFSLNYQAIFAALIIKYIWKLTSKIV